ncbi:MAG: dihydrodipicolinate synthase family protein [bacterium]|nr:dihydrodipicolinate synthase family protein [bacterium]
MSNPLLRPATLARLCAGCVIPAHPLALDAAGRFDERHQRAITRYYLECGAGGTAVGVHSTQFEIRSPEFGLFEPVLRNAAETMDEYERRHSGEAVIRIAGICGRTEQAIAEARLARELGYEIGLLSLAAFSNDSVDDMLAHARRVADEIAVMGFYLQPSVGGRELHYEFWRRFCDIENVAAIKIAPFNRYQTLDVARAVAQSGRSDEIALYTGNDDSIVFDLCSSFSFVTEYGPRTVRMAGGLLGHWAFWTKSAVELHRRIAVLRDSNDAIPPDLMKEAWRITDVNAAAFDARNRFAGCIAGINEMLRRQGLMTENRCLLERERLSPGQYEDIDRVWKAYPSLRDDDFVRANVERWLGN